MSSHHRDDNKVFEQSNASSINNDAQPKKALNIQPKRLTKRRGLTISPSLRKINQTFEIQTEENSLALKLKCDERYFRIREKQKEFKSVVAELLRLELLKTGIKREEISKL